MSEKSYDFVVGEKAVYPSHGVGTIEMIESRDVGGLIQEFYVLKIHGTGARVMVPTRSAKTIGMRTIVSPPDVERIFEILKSPACKKANGTWNRRFRTLNDKINTGDLIEIAEVLRDLSSLRQNKDLSFGEKKMLERAKAMLISEISVARDSDFAAIERELNQTELNCHLA